MVAIEALHGIWIVNGPDRLLGLVHKHGLHAAVDALLHARRAAAGVFRAAHRVGYPAVEGGRIGCLGRQRSQRTNCTQQKQNTLHEKPPLGNWELSNCNHHPPPQRTSASKHSAILWVDGNIARDLPAWLKGFRAGLRCFSERFRSAATRLKTG